MYQETELEKISRETMEFMRGRYRLDELGDGKDELKFRQGKKTILTIYIREDRYDFMLIFGKLEREKFEEQREQFSPEICAIYDESKTYHDGKWMMFPVEHASQLEELKKLVMMKKKPNRKPFAKETAVYSSCGHRCDLCLHYTGGTISEEFRQELTERLTRVWGNEDWSMRCGGCQTQSGDPCEQKRCAAEKGFSACIHCDQYPCNHATVASSKIEAKSTLADDITWAILPFVPGQYGN